MDPDDLFFVNKAGSKLPKLQNYDGPGSLLRKFELVTGVKGFNFTMLRKSLEGKIQNREGLRSSVKDLNSHSSTVGAAVYDTMQSARRSVLMNSLDVAEGSCLELNPEYEASQEQVVKRLKIDAVENQRMIDRANKFLYELKNRVPPDFSPAAVNNDDLECLKEIFADYSFENTG